ncbi:MAG: bifunctional diaminohydroxyphosphoribosylaminopyrimidine deaminase/5-amino-6-(5-phosphoribosylamino)uracil reductase RibD [Candidatus Krumholzibacteria bacterium]|nr:bifunctional diaminohydroxyphosphoribosylaminopyrimidine deaminase/5-amino-6-(5-phosphoribosylamino)uracil reductase RibD [Candidatus Krumholzibacteria bacterium]
MDNEEKYIRRALELAENGLGRTFPNPLVGAVVVSGGEIVGEGYHKGPGQPHAEIEAIRAAGDRAKGAALYLNLEPCCHYGRTPPCTDGIAEAGISRVVFSMYDPDERVRGKGVAALRGRGIEVKGGVCAVEALELNLHYVHRNLSGRPFIILKLASTLDGRLTWGAERFLSGEKEQRFIHRLRAWTEAIAIGIGTVSIDHPKLDRRLFRENMQPPVRMVFDSALSFPEDYPWLARRERVIIYCLTNVDPIRRRELETAGAEVVPLPRGPHGVDLRFWLEDVSAKEITSVIVEGGGEVATAFLGEGLLDRLVLCYAPLVSGMAGVSWYQDGRGPQWLARGELALKSCATMDDDLVLIYDSRRLGDYLAAVTEEKIIVHWTR